MVKLNKNQIKSIVRDWVEVKPLRDYKIEQQKLISELKNCINNLVEVNNKIYKIEEKAFNYASESESESESESDNESEREFDPRGFHRITNEDLKTLSKLKPGDKFKGMTYGGTYNKDTNISWGRKKQ